MNTSTTPPSPETLEKFTLAVEDISPKIIDKCIHFKNIKHPLPKVWIIQMKDNPLDIRMTGNFMTYVANRNLDDSNILSAPYLEIAETPLEELIEEMTNRFLPNLT